MKIPLLSGLWKFNSEKSELEPGIETILDIKRENSFLWKLVFLLVLIALAQTATLLIKMRASRSAAPTADAGDIAYGDEVQRSSQTAISVAPALVALVPDATITNPPSIASVDRPKESASRTANQAIQRITKTETPSPGVTAPGQDRTEPSFWDLLKEAQNDPDREILDRTFSANGLAIHLEEMSKTRILHFELENTSNRIAYLPKIEVLGTKTRVYFERQVLEPETSQQGLLVFADPKASGSVDAIISAANIAAFKVRIDIPKWRR